MVIALCKNFLAKDCPYSRGLRKVRLEGAYSSFMLLRTR